MRKLNVKKSDFNEVSKNWKQTLPEAWRHKMLYVRCNKYGNVNWAVAPIFFAEELISRGNYQVH